MTLVETIEKFTHNAEYEKMYGNIQRCLIFKQLAEWLKELKELRENASVPKTKSNPIIDELAKKPPMIIETAYLYAINITLYGENVTEKRTTSVQQHSALKAAYNRGFYEALSSLSESDDKISFEKE